MVKVPVVSGEDDRTWKVEYIRKNGRFAYGYTTDIVYKKIFALMVGGTVHRKRWNVAPISKSEALKRVAREVQCEWTDTSWTDDTHIVTTEMITEYLALIDTQDASVTEMIRILIKLRKPWKDIVGYGAIRMWVIHYINEWKDPCIGFTTSQSEMEKFVQVKTHLSPHPPWQAELREGVDDFVEARRRIIHSYLGLYYLAMRGKFRVDLEWDDDLVTTLDPKPNNPQPSQRKKHKSRSTGSNKATHSVAETADQEESTCVEATPSAWLIKYIDDEGRYYIGFTTDPFLKAKFAVMCGGPNINQQWQVEEVEWKLALGIMAREKEAMKKEVDRPGYWISWTFANRQYDETLRTTVGVWEAYEALVKRIRTIRKALTASKKVSWDVDTELVDQIHQELAGVQHSEEQEKIWYENTKGKPTALWAIKYTDEQGTVRTGFTTSKSMREELVKIWTLYSSIWLGKFTSFYTAREKVVTDLDTLSHWPRKLVDDTWDVTITMTTGLNKSHEHNLACKAPSNAPHKRRGKLQ
ncbi:hypothetical protein K491DRAFT_723669 [Lophiostoma macrostomum CBS 122681]|uniref:Uncharacterized protein n=1 Tax=Lophiostoma macrostomum CBS 122681 TaxID=1314788 RepID=A0A6A6SJI9_9PLEO|nr:hypothetical protein K491DRAFT_723669 [Lophiostoma macrostomum CBS 122681]